MKREMFGLLFLFLVVRAYNLCNSYTTGCPPVRGDDPRALASGLSYVHVDKQSITMLNHQHWMKSAIYTAM